MRERTTEGIACATATAVSGPGLPPGAPAASSSPPREAYVAAAVGSWLHGAAATLASQGGPVVAGDVAAALPDLIATLTTP